MEEISDKVVGKATALLSLSAKRSQELGHKNHELLVKTIREIAVGASTFDYVEDFEEFEQLAGTLCACICEANPTLTIKGACDNTAKLLNIKAEDHDDFIITTLEGAVSVYEELEDWDQVHVIHNYQLLVDPFNTEVMACISEQLYSTERFDEAEKYCSMAIKIDPSDAGSILMRGICRELLGNSTGAEEDYLRHEEIFGGK